MDVGECPPSKKASSSNSVQCLAPQDTSTTLLIMCWNDEDSGALESTTEENGDEALGDGVEGSESTVSSESEG